MSSSPSSADYSRRAPPEDFREPLLLVAKMPVQSLLRRARSGCVPLKFVIDKGLWSGFAAYRGQFIDYQR
jgi:hypothetical protein